MRLKLPKFVEISNPQINRLYNGLTLVAACYVVYEFFWLFKFASFMEIGQFVSSDIWVSDRLNPEEKTAIAEQWNVEPLCTDPETYNYESVNGPWSYTNNSCLFPCDESRVRDTCLLNVENYLNVEASEVFIPTQMKETTYHRDMDEQTSQYFMPMAEDLRIDFTHSLEVKESAIRAQMTTGPWDWGDIIGFSDQAHLQLHTLAFLVRC